MFNKICKGMAASQNDSGVITPQTLTNLELACIGNCAYSALVGKMRCANLIAIYYFKSRYYHNITRL